MSGTVRTRALERSTGAGSAKGEDLHRFPALALSHLSHSRSNVTARELPEPSGSRAPFAAVRERRDLVSDAIFRQLELIRGETGSDIVLVIEIQSVNQSDGTVIAASTSDAAHRFLANEPVRMTGHLPSRVRVVSDLGVVSTIRPLRVQFGSSVTIPWCSRDTSGWLIVGNVEQSAAHGLSGSVGRRYSRELRQTYIDAGLRNTTKLQRDLAQAIRRLSECELDFETEEELLANVIAVGRGLLKTSACYMSMPENEGDVFSFSGFLGVRTKAFKNLRISAGQGLGGVARLERRVVRSLNYAQDFSERDAPVMETVREGFLSAMCAPLVGDGKVLGCLYVANRHLTPFSSADGNLMEEFANNVSFIFRRSHWDRIRQSTARRIERDHIARDLHDTVVRGLMEIGYESRLGRDRRDAKLTFGHFEAIERAAESCLQTIRGHIGTLTRESEGTQHLSAADVLGKLRALNRPRNLRYEFELGKGTEAQTIEPNVAAALVNIAGEAIQNAELHSGGSLVKVELAVVGKSVELTIDDDGRGMDFDTLAERLTRHDHVGLVQMRSLAKGVGGQCILAKSPSGGLRVRVKGESS